LSSRCNKSKGAPSKIMGAFAITAILLSVVWKLFKAHHMPTANWLKCGTCEAWDSAMNSADAWIICIDTIN
jgi:hypothetical protein